VIMVIGCWVLGSCSWACVCKPGSPILQESISAYYGTLMRNVFVGLLFAIAFFLFSYKGYEKDWIAGKLAASFAVLVALFPITSECRWIQGVHLAAAAGLFLTFAFFSLFLFTKSNDEIHRTPQKLKRNKIYVACGVAIVVFIALIGVYYLLLEHTAIARMEPVFCLETLALWAFGISWMTKGELILSDQAR
jgi:hypothetical protein